MTGTILYMITSYMCKVKEICYSILNYKLAVEAPSNKKQTC